MFKMTRQDLSVAFLWLVTVAAAGWAIYASYGLIKVALPAIIAAIAALMSAILTHALVQIREQEQRATAAKQQNYADLLSSAAAFIRDRSKKDELDRIRMLSWVVGSHNVVVATENFGTNTDNASLQKLLAAMRDDLKLTPMPDDTKMTVFEALPPPGSL